MMRQVSFLQSYCFAVVLQFTILYHLTCNWDQKEIESTFAIYSNSTRDKSTDYL